MKKNCISPVLGSVAASCVLGMMLPQKCLAVVSDEEFNELKNLVLQLQQEHQQDQQQIRQLQEKLGVLQSSSPDTAASTDTLAQAFSVPAHSALHHFDLAGGTQVQYAKTFGNATHGGFLLADFAPDVFYRASDNILFEGGFDVFLRNGSFSGTTPGGGYFYSHDGGSSTAIDLRFAQLDYLANDYLTFVGGYMLLPLGTYSERAAGWLNKIPDAPLGREFLPAAGVGAQLRGAVPLGANGQAITYTVYGANGPSASNSLASASSLDLNGNVGLQNSGRTGNLNSTPSGGGRLGWFYPWAAHQDLEIGVSGQTGTWDDAGNHYWTAGVLDAALHLGPNFEIKGEFINSWYGTDDLGEVHPWAVWTQAGYKLAGLNHQLPALKNLELIGRFDQEDDGQGTSTDRYTFGYIYYLTDTLLFEGDYEWLDSHGPNALPPNFLVFQVSYGF
jgi:hypothetical protein